MLITSIVCVALTFLSVYIGYHIGRGFKGSSEQQSYYKGRMDGWKACENLVMERMVKSKNIGLTKREILNEFFV